MFRLKTNFYENGEKSGKLLSMQLKQREAGYVIPGIKNAKEEVVTSIKEINQVFQNFYSKLYTS